MKTRKKTIIALLVALVMLLVIVPITVFAGTGTQETPFVAADKTTDGTSKHCLELWLCDENGKPIKSLEKHYNNTNCYQVPQDKKTSFFVTVKYANGDDVNKNDWVTVKDGVIVQTSKLLVFSTLNNNGATKVSFNGQYFSNTDRGFISIDDLPIKIEMNNLESNGQSKVSIPFMFSDDTKTQFNVNTFAARFFFTPVLNPVNKVGIDETAIADIPAQTYTGEAITPELNITYDGKTLVKDTDYTVEFANNTEVGTASVTITGIGDYDWHVTKTFEIQAAEPVAPELVSSKGKDLIAKTYTDLELQNAPGEGYEYKFIVYNETTNQWYKLQDYSDLTTFSWYTGPAGVKNLYVDIKNKNDETDVTRVELTGVNVTDSGLAATLAIEPTGELAAKSQAKLTATAENGTAPYEYKFIVFNATTNQWYKLKDFGPESEFDWYTGPAGTKTLYVDVKDANGVVVRQPLENIVVK